MNDIAHIGELIKQKLKEQERSVAWLARQLSTDRSNLRRTLQYPDVHVSVIKRISDILGHDFFKDCSALLKEAEDGEENK